MNKTIDLSLVALDAIEAPLTDMEWGVIGVTAFGIGMYVGYVLVAT